MNKPTIIFFGTSAFAVPALDLLIKSGFTLSAVVTAPDKPAGRAMHLRRSAVKEYILKNNPQGAIVVFEPEKITEEFIELIASYKPFVGVVAAYGIILPKALIELFPKGIMNIHPSLLPKYRGPSPIQGAILAGDTETGATIMQIDEKMDHGPIIATAIYKLPASVTYQELHDALAKIGAGLLVRSLPQWLESKIMPCPQDDAIATYTKLLKKEDGRIDWSRDAIYIERMVRVYNPWPGAYTTAPNGRIIKLLRVEVVDTDTSGHAGLVFLDNKALCVFAGKGAVKILALQPESKNVLSPEAYLRSNKEIVGSLLR